MADSAEDVAAVFEDLGDLEKEFAQVELDALRRKEFHLSPLYDKRKLLLERVPDFWSTVFGNGPQEVTQFFSPEDLPLIASVKSFSVDRFQITSETEGEPRSLRFTFEFERNDFFHDTVLVKEFKYIPREDGPGNLISTPVPIKWKSKKVDLTRGVLDAAVQLHAEEEALKLKDGKVEIVDREALWSHEKLREKLVKLDEDESQEPSFFNWFGFRGAVNAGQSKKPVENGANGAEGGEGNEEDDELDQLLEVEIFPAGEEVAIALAEELWSDAMDHFMTAQDEGAFDGEGFELENDSEFEDDAPELVPVEEDARPRKRQRQD